MAVLCCLGGQAGAIFVFCPPDVCCYVLVVCFWVCEYVYVVCVTRDLRFCLFCFYWLFLFFLPPRIILSCSDLFINSILLLKKKKKTNNKEDMDKIVPVYFSLGLIRSFDFF